VLEVVLMSNADYREKIEEHRQSIELEEKQSSRMSRSRGKVKPKKRKNPLINILLFVLLGIPFSLLIYVSFFYSPGDAETAEVEKNDSIVELQTNHTVSASAKEKKEPVIEETDDKTVATTENTVSEEQKAEETKAKAAAEEAAKKEEQAKLEQQELAKQQAQKEEQAKQEEQAKKQTAGGTTHTVQPNENLFRIALKYYGDSSGVDKIRAANNLPSNSISVGQTLIIP